MPKDGKGFRADLAVGGEDAWADFGDLEVGWDADEDGAVGGVLPDFVADFTRKLEQGACLVIAVVLLGETRLAFGAWWMAQGWLRHVVVCHRWSENVCRKMIRVEVLQDKAGT